MKRLHLADHLTAEEMEQRYRQASDPVARSQWQMLWLLRRGDIITLEGEIARLNRDSFKLRLSDERIAITAATQVLALVKPVSTSTLAVGRSVTIQATYNEQGQLVAQRISLRVPVQHKAGPPYMTMGRGNTSSQ